MAEVLISELNYSSINLDSHCCWYVQKQVFLFSGGKCFLKGSFNASKSVQKSFCDYFLLLISRTLSRLFSTQIYKILCTWDFRKYTICVPGTFGSTQTVYLGLSEVHNGSGKYTMCTDQYTKKYTVLCTIVG